MADNGNISSSWKILQVGLVVKDMDKSINRLSKLGFGPFIPKLLPKSTRPGPKAKPMLGKVDVQRTMLGNVELELCQPVSGESPHRDFLDAKGEGIQHILFSVPDLEAELDRFNKLGAKVLMHLTFNGGGLAYVDLNACGFIIELIQLPTDDPETLKTVLSR